MSAITWSLSDERSGNFDGWGVVRGWLFKLGDRDMSIEKVYEVIKGYQCSELLMVLNPALAVWNHQQKEIDSLKAQLNNMERCYIDVKKERDDLVSKNEPKNKRPDPSTCIHEPVSCWLVVECAKCGVML